MDKEIGSIEVGKCADLTLINLDRLHTTPHPDPVSTMVYHAEASDVETVMIGGNVVMRAGELTVVNELTIVRRSS